MSQQKQSNDQSNSNNLRIISEEKKYSIIKIRKEERNLNDIESESEHPRNHKWFLIFSGVDENFERYAKIFDYLHKIKELVIIKEIESIQYILSSEKKSFLETFFGYSGRLYFIANYPASFDLVSYQERCI